MAMSTDSKLYLSKHNAVKIPYWSWILKWVEINLSYSIRMFSVDLYEIYRSNIRRKLQNHQSGTLLRCALSVCVKGCPKPPSRRASAFSSNGNAASNEDTLLEKQIDFWCPCGITLEIDNFPFKILFKQHRQPKSRRSEIVTCPCRDCSPKTSLC